ncbi:hypothetical protein [Mollivirus kamchatka]|nr:hypothetical protein [Mollivirus kamchatka]
MTSQNEEAMEVEATPAVEAQAIIEPELWQMVQSFVEPSSRPLFAAVCRTFRKVSGPIDLKECAKVEFCGVDHDVLGPDGRPRAYVDYSPMEKTTTAQKRRRRRQCMKFREDPDLFSIDYMCHLAFHGHLAAIQWARSLGCPWDSGVTDAAAQGNQIPTLDWLIDNGCDWGTETRCAAAMFGNIEALERLHERLPSDDHEVCSAAAQWGSLAVIKWLRSHGYEWDGHVIPLALLEGFPELARWAYSNGAPKSAMRLGSGKFVRWKKAHNSNHCRKAVAEGDLDKLKRLKAEGYRWKEKTMAGAIFAGRTAMVEWMHQEGCPWDGHALGAAAKKADHHMIRWLCGKGCPGGYLPTAEAICNKDLGTLQLLDQLGRLYKGGLVTRELVAHADLEMLQWLTLRGCKWDKSMATSAIDKGRLDMAEWLYSQGYPFHNDALACLVRRGQIQDLGWMISKTPCRPSKLGCLFAAQEGRLDVLKWFKQQQWPWNARVCTAAAERGDLEMLQWARENGCKWDKRACSAAAAKGHLEVLQWLHYNGCPWTKSTTISAAERNHLDVLQWAYDKGCPLDAEMYVTATRFKTTALLQWLFDNNCPCDRSTISKMRIYAEDEQREWMRQTVDKPKVPETGHQSLGCRLS